MYIIESAKEVKAKKDIAPGCCGKLVKEFASSDEKIAGSAQGRRKTPQVAVMVWAMRRLWKGNKSASAQQKILDSRTLKSLLLAFLTMPCVGEYLCPLCIP